MYKVVKFLSPGIFPFSICAFLLIFIFFYRIFHLPSATELISIIIGKFNVYGFGLLFVAAFLEGLFIIGIYFPGSLVIALAVYSLGSSTENLIIIGFIAFIAFLISNICNYYIGRFGYHRFFLLIGKKDIIKKMEKLMQKNNYKSFILTGIFPNFIAITSVCAGISKLRIGNTIIILTISLLFWVTVWTIIGSVIIKHVDLTDKNQSIYILLIIFAWGVYLVCKENYLKFRSIHNANY